MKNVFIIALAFILLVAPVSAYTVTINTAEYPAGTTIASSSVEVNGQVQIANPFATFNNVPESAVVNISNSASGFNSDLDQLYFDSQLRSCTTQSTCTISSNNMNTQCNLGNGLYYCASTDSNGAQSYFAYNPANKRISYTNFLTAVSGQAPFLQADVTPLEGYAPQIVTFTNEAMDNGQVVSVVWNLGDGTVISSSPADSFSHTYLLPGTYTIRVQATDDEGLTSEELFTLTLNSNQNPPASSLPFNDNVIYSVTASTGDWNTGLTLPTSQITLDSNAPQSANPFTTFDVRSNTQIDVTNSAVGYGTDTNQYFFDFQLPTCSGAECSLVSRNVFGNEYVTECDLNQGIYQCSVENNGLHTFFAYNPSNDRISVVNLLVSDAVNQSGVPPTIFADVDDTSGSAPLNVSFSASVVDDNSVDRVIWFFGDGTSQNVGEFSNINHIYGRGGTYNARIAAWDNEGLVSTQDFTISVSGVQSPNQFLYDPTERFDVTASTGDWNTKQTISQSTITLSVDGSQDSRTANPFAQFQNLQSDTVYDITNSVAGYTTDTNQYYFDHGLSTCSGNSCDLTSKNLFGSVFNTRCDLNNRAMYQCEVENNGLHTFYVYNPANGRISVVNFLVDDSVIANDNPATIYISADKSEGDAPFDVELQNYITDLDGVNRSLWFFGDGTSQNVEAVDQITHTFEQPGIYNVQLVTWDQNGVATSKNLTITATKFGKLPEGDRESIFVRSIRIDNQDDLLPGDDVVVHLTFKNDGTKKIKQVKAIASIPELGVRASQGTSLTLYENQDRRETLLLYMPEDVQPGTYWVRIQIKGDSEDRVLHREIIVKEPKITPKVGVIGDL